jgi:hypothetical protein
MVSLDNNYSATKPLREDKPSIVNNVEEYLNIKLGVAYV